MLYIYIPFVLCIRSIHVSAIYSVETSQSDATWSSKILPQIFKININRLERWECVIWNFMFRNSIVICIRKPKSLSTPTEHCRFSTKYLCAMKISPLPHKDWIIEVNHIQHIFRLQAYIICNFEHLCSWCRLCSNVRHQNWRYRFGLCDALMLYSYFQVWCRYMVLSKKKHWNRLTIYILCEKRNSFEFYGFLNIDENRSQPKPATNWQKRT